MRGQPGYPAYNFGPDEYHYGGSFGCNGASDPELDSIRRDLGFHFSVVHAGTGLYDVTVGGEFILPRGFPEVVLVSAQIGSVATYFDAYVVGEADFSTPGSLTFRIATLVAGTATDMAEADGARVNFSFYAQNNTGK